MAKTRLFISFDFDHDSDLRTMLVGQSWHPDTPFEFADWSLKEALSGDWKAKIRTRIKSVDQVVVLCGAFTHVASGVAIELDIAREEAKPYFLLWGRANTQCTRPSNAYATDKVYKWTWDNIKSLVGGAR